MNNQSGKNHQNLSGSRLSRFFVEPRSALSKCLLFRKISIPALIGCSFLKFSLIKKLNCARDLKDYPDFRVEANEGCQNRLDPNFTAHPQPCRLSGHRNIPFIERFAC